MHATLSCHSGSGRCFKLMSTILAIIEEQLRMDDETTATQLVKIVIAAGYNIFNRILHYIASRTLVSFGLTWVRFGCLGFPLFLVELASSCKFTITAFHRLCHNSDWLADLQASHRVRFPTKLGDRLQEHLIVVACWVFVADRTMTLSISPTLANVFRDLCLSFNVDALAIMYECTIVYIGENCQLLTVTD